MVDMLVVCFDTRISVGDFVTQTQKKEETRVSVVTLMYFAISCSMEEADQSLVKCLMIR